MVAHVGILLTCESCSLYRPMIQPFVAPFTLRVNGRIVTQLVVCFFRTISGRRRPEKATFLLCVQSRRIIVDEAFEHELLWQHKDLRENPA
jgi:hypothetical protein